MAWLFDVISVIYFLHLKTNRYEKIYTYAGPGRCSFFGFL